jgi:hypothetical protein
MKIERAFVTFYFKRFDREGQARSRGFRLGVGEGSCILALFNPQHFVVEILAFSKMFDHLQLIPEAAGLILKSVGTVRLRMRCFGTMNTKLNSKKDRLSMNVLIGD